VIDWSRFRTRGARSAEPFDAFSDARPATGVPRPRDDDPDAARRVKLRRRAFVFVVSAISFAGCVAAIVGEEGLLDMIRLQDEIRELQADIDTRRADVIRLESEIEGLKTDPGARERIAREQLGLAPEGEIQFLLPREGGAGPVESPLIGGE